MKTFMEEYGLIVVAAIIIMIFVLVATPIGTSLKDGVRTTVDKFTSSMVADEDDTTSGSISVTAKDSEGNDLNASARNITGEEKDTLLASLESASLIASTDDVDALIDVQSDHFDGLAETTFDVSNIAKEGDTVVILHYDETAAQWEYITTDTVDANLTVGGDFSSYSPVAFVVISGDNGSEGEEGTETLAPGLYDAQGNMTMSWQELIDGEYLFINDNGTLYADGCGDSGYGGNHTISELEGELLVIDNRVTKIADYAFQATGCGMGCSDIQITTIIIPNGVTSIGECSFCDYSNLILITIPNSVTTIKNCAFQSCENLTDINYLETIEEWNSIELNEGRNGWNYESPEITVHCTDGNIIIPANN